MRVWDKLENAFPSWEIHHTGGGNFVIRRDFMDLNGDAVMVAISDTLALIIKDTENSNRYITLSEFLDNEDIYWDKAGHLEITIAYMKEKEPLLTDDSKIFDPDALEEIITCTKKVNEIMWEQSY